MREPAQKIAKIMHRKIRRLMYNNASCIITIFTLNGNKTKPKDKKSKCINSTIVFLNHSENNFYGK